MMNVRLRRGLTAVGFVFLISVFIFATFNSNLSNLSLTGYFVSNGNSKMGLDSLDGNILFFSDGFESASLNDWKLDSTLDAKSWSISSRDPSQVSYHASSSPLSSGESIMERRISTVGYENIKVSYDRKLIGLDSSDYFKVQWYDGFNWISLEEVNSVTDEIYVSRSFNLPSIADNKVNFKIRFICSSGALEEYCLVDNVGISGLKR